MSFVKIEFPRMSTDAMLPEQREDAAPTREIRHEYTRSLAPLLSQLGVSLLVSTYQAGKVAAVGVAAGELTLSYHNFERAMGLAVKPNGIAVAARAQVWFLHAAPDLAARVDPGEPGRHDGCFLTRCSHFTGAIQAHELAWVVDELWVVNTAFGCLCTLDGRPSFVPRWRPPFLTDLAADDRCHLNGLAVADGAPRYVTALAESDTPQGWRANKVESGCLIDVASGQTVARGFAMPHSPRVHCGRVWMLHSGAGQLVLVDLASGRAETVSELPGYTRGLALYDHFAFVGLSKIREASMFGGMPIAERERHAVLLGQQGHDRQRIVEERRYGRRHRAGRGHQSRQRQFVPDFPQERRRTLFFSADDGIHGNELWELDIADGQGGGTIPDDQPRVSISDVAKVEGRKGKTTLFTFTVTLSVAYDQPVSMSFQTVNGTAKTSDRDYVAKSGTLTFAPGETSRTITIEVKGDGKREANETFYVDLFGLSPGAAGFTKKRGLGTILNDD
jgi:uncharacterized protein (TIGR03032 family)